MLIYICMHIVYAWYKHEVVPEGGAKCSQFHKAICSSKKSHRGRDTAGYGNVPLCSLTLCELSCLTALSIANAARVLSHGQLLFSVVSNTIWIFSYCKYILWRWKRQTVPNQVKHFQLLKYPLLFHRLWEIFITKVTHFLDPFTVKGLQLLVLLKARYYHIHHSVLFVP